MSKLVVMPVKNADEFAEAYNIALSVFSENSSMQEYESYKLFSWTKDPHFSYNNVLLARYNGEAVGLIRIVPRKLFRGDTSISVAGISSVCLLPALRGVGLSVPLMEQTLAYCTGQGYEIAFLFARRAADHYYTQFGFHGIASYARVFVSKPQFSDKGEFNVSLSEIDPSLCDIYSEAYTYSYQACFGRIERTGDYWKYIITSASWRKEFRFLTLKNNNVAIGYVIAGDNKIFEIATNIDIPGDELIHVIISNEIVRLVNDKLEIEILPQHRLLHCLQGTEITLQTRECTYGGHMAKILNINSVMNKTKKWTALTNKECEDLKQKIKLSYSDTCVLLGVLSPTGTYTRETLPFDIGSIDHF